MIRIYLVAIVALGASLSALAIMPSKVERSFQLVGVISESSGKSPGIVVLKDSRRKTPITLTLKEGSILPHSDGWQVAEVERGAVRLKRGTQIVSLSFSGRTQPEPPKFGKSKSNTYLRDFVSDESFDSLEGGMFSGLDYNRGSSSDQEPAQNVVGPRSYPVNERSPLSVDPSKLSSDELYDLAKMLDRLQQQRENSINDSDDYQFVNSRAEVDYEAGEGLESEPTADGYDSYDFEEVDRLAPDIEDVESYRQDQDSYEDPYEYGGDQLPY